MEPQKLLTCSVLQLETVGKVLGGKEWKGYVFISLLKGWESILFGSAGGEGLLTLSHPRFLFLLRLD